MTIDKRKMKRMTLEELESLIARHGARTALWPPETRAAGEALLKRSAEASALIARHQALDDLLGAMPPLAAPDGLHAGIMATIARADAAAKAAPFPAVPQGSAVGRMFGRLSGFWPQAVGFAAASLLGFMIGTAEPNLLPLEERTDLSAYIVGYEDESFMTAIIEDVQP